jgi:hypothetical protein
MLLSSPGSNNAKRNLRRLFLLVMFLLCGAALTYVLRETFVRYTASITQTYIDSVHAVVPESVFWFAPASILGTILAYNVVYFQQGMLLPGRVRALAVLLAIGSIVLAYFGAHSSLRLAENEIIFRRLWSVEKERLRYSDVKALKEVYYPADETVVFVIEFHHAPEWTTAVEVVFPGEREKAFLSERTGKTIEKLVAN